MTDTITSIYDYITRQRGLMLTGDNINRVFLYERFRTLKQAHRRAAELNQQLRGSGVTAGVTNGCLTNGCQ